MRCPLLKPLLPPATFDSQLLLCPVFKMGLRELGGLGANTCPQSSLCVLKTFSRDFLHKCHSRKEGEPAPKGREGKVWITCLTETLESLGLLSHPQCLLKKLSLIINASLDQFPYTFTQSLPCAAQGARPVPRMSAASAVAQGTF